MTGGLVSNYHCAKCGHDFRHVPGNRVHCPVCDNNRCRRGKVGGGECERSRYTPERKDRIKVNQAVFKARRREKYGGQYPLTGYLCPACGGRHKAVKGEGKRCPACGFYPCLKAGVGGGLSSQSKRAVKV